MNISAHNSLISYLFTFRLPGGPCGTGRAHKKHEAKHVGMDRGA